MIERPESPLPPAGQLTTGHYRMKNCYARWRPRGAPGWLLVYTLGGRGRFGHSHGDLIVSRGDLVLIWPKTLHDYGLEDRLRRWDHIWAYFFPRADWHALFHWPELAPGLMRLQMPDEKTRRSMLQQLTESNRLNNGPLKQREMFALNALEKCLLQCDLINPLSQQAQLDPRVLRALSFICENLSEPIVVPALARHCGLSRSRFTHLFRAQVGQTPVQFVELQRLTHARRLLEHTQNSIAEIAAELGFYDSFHFSHRFKCRLGLSPRAYRQRLARSQPIPWQPSAGNA